MPDHAFPEQNTLAPPPGSTPAASAAAGMDRAAGRFGWGRITLLALVLAGGLAAFLAFRSLSPPALAPGPCWCPQRLPASRHQP